MKYSTLLLALAGLLLAPPQALAQDDGSPPPAQEEEGVPTPSEKDEDQEEDGSPDGPPPSSQDSPDSPPLSSDGSDEGAVPETEPGAQSAPGGGTNSAPDSDELPPEEQPITQPPSLLTFVEAEYPARALEERVESDVVLEIDIDIEGNVEGVSVVVPSPAADYGFDEAATIAAFQFKFSPAYAGETPVPVRISYRYRFVLAEEPVPEDAPEPDPVVNLRGQLVVRGGREPMPGELVTVFRTNDDGEEEGYESTTDENGAFEFYDLGIGSWNVLVEADGFFPVRSVEEIREGELTEVRYFVERGSYSAFDVLVEASRPRKEVNRTSLDIAQVERIPGTAGDVLTVVQNLPGVARAQAFSGEIIVRGASPEDTKVFVEGMEIPLVYHFFGLRSVIPTPMLDGIDFYPGNFSLNFGRAIGGIVDVRLKRLEPERIGGIFDVSILDASLYLEAPLGEKGAIAVAGRRSYIDFLFNAVDSDEINVSTAPRYWDTQLLLQYRPSAAHGFRAFGLVSSDELRILFSNPSDQSIDIQGSRFSSRTLFYRAILEYDYTPNKLFRNTAQASVGYDETDNTFAQLRFDVASQSVQLRDTATLSFTDNVKWSSGVDYLLSIVDVDIALPLPPREGEPEDPDFDIGPEGLQFQRVRNRNYHSLGLFSQLELTLAEKLLVIPGVRANYYGRLDSWKASPRITARYSVSDQWTLKGGVGLFYQEPPIDETDDVFGNPDIDPEGAIHYSLGAEYRPLKYLTIDITGFYKNLFDMVATSDNLVERDGELVTENVRNSGNGRVYGLEALIRHDFANNFSGWLAYTLSRSERRDQAGQPRRLFDFDQTHILAVLGTYRLPRNWEVGFRWRYVSGNPTTPIVNGVFNADRDIYEQVNGRINSDRIPAFHQLDLRVDKKWIFDRWKFNAYLDLQNVYNRENPDEVSYNFDFTERTFTQGFPILAILGLRAEF